MRFIFLLFFGLAFAHVQLASALHRVYHFGEAVGIGSLAFFLDSDSFASATPEQPLYIRLVFEYGVTLADTRVDSSIEGRLGSPIYLPILLNPQEPHGIRVVAPRDSVAIVRWVAGENEVWFRIQRSSSTWLQQEDGTYLVPNSIYDPLFEIGHRIERYEDLLPNSASNMTYPTRDPQVSERETAVSTNICANLSGFTMSRGSSIYMSASAYHAEAEIAPGRFQALNPIPDFFEYPVAELGTTAHWAQVGRLHGESAVFGAEGQRIEGETRAQLQLQFANPWYSYDQTSAYWGRDSYLDLWLPPELEAGFSDSSLGFELAGQAAGEVELDPTQAFDLAGKRLYRHIRVKWSEAALDLEQPIELSVLVKLGWNPSLQPEQIQITYALVQASNPDLWFPISTLPDQQSCAPMSQTLDEGVWRPFTQPSALDFPHLTAATGGFSTRVLLGNSGNEPLELQVQGFTSVGAPLHLQTVALTGGETQSLDPASLFDGQASHLRILTAGSAPLASLRYQALTEGAIAADVLAAAAAGKAWRLYSVQQVGAWDGFALVNRGSTPSRIRLLSYDASGTLLEERELARLSPDEKLALVLPLVPAASYHELRSEEPISLVALRGDSSNQYLWSNPVMRLAD